MSSRERRQRAPAGAVGWTPRDGWIYEPVDLPTRVTDGLVRGVTAVTTAPLVALLRVEADVVELVEALRDVAESFAERLAGRDGGAS